MKKWLEANGGNSRQEKAEYKPAPLRQNFTIAFVPRRGGHLDFKVYAP
jgi:hypothetical protein